MKMLRLMICLVGLCWLASPAPAQEGTGPRDGVSGLVDCGGELSPADRMHCENVQLDAADDDLNRIYRTLMEVLDRDAKAMLLDGQRGWLKYRDRNLELFSSAASPGGQEGMARQIHWLRELTQARVRELEDLYRLFQENGLLAVDKQGPAPAEPQAEPVPVPSDEPAVVSSAPAVPAPEPPAPVAQVEPVTPQPILSEPATMQPEAPAPAPSVEVPQSPQPASAVPSKGVIVLNGKVVRPSDFNITPNTGQGAVPQSATPRPQPAPSAVAAPDRAAVQDAPSQDKPAPTAPAPAAPAQESPAATEPLPTSAHDAAAKDPAFAIPAPVRPDAPAPAQAPSTSGLVLDGEPHSGPPMPEAPARTAVKSEAGLRALLGRHPLRLQWLSSEPFGEVVIEDRGGTLHLLGSQGQGQDRLTIDGIVTTVRADNFTFHGTVTTSAGFLNGGEPCVRQGRMWFVRKHGRPFWRLQSITNPCTGVSDYIDIYLEAIRN